MGRPTNAMDIFRLLDQSNCRECGEKTCLAFAGAVFTGRRDLGACPRLSRETVERFEEVLGAIKSPEQAGEESLAKLRSGIAAIDLAEAAARTGGVYKSGKLILKVLGKDFGVDDTGNLYAEIHVNPWVAVPFLNHVLQGSGAEPTGNWMPFRELAGGKERYPLFQQRCEKPLKQVADTYTDLFDDMVHIFGGKQVEHQFESDISVVMHPLPRVPLMVCYWQAEDGMQSSLNVFFDDTAVQNLDIGSIFSLGAGLAQMFEKLALRHGMG